MDFGLFLIRQKALEDINQSTTQLFIIRLLDEVKNCPVIVAKLIKFNAYPHLTSWTDDEEYYSGLTQVKCGKISYYSFTWDW